MPITIAYVISNINKSLAFEWIAEGVCRSKVSLTFILLNEGDSTLERWLIAQGIAVYRVPYRGKTDSLVAIRKVYAIFKAIQPLVVHCHLFEACLVGLLAAKLARVPKRIYTRHHSTLHHQYFPRAVWYDRFVNALATHIVAISENVRQVLTEREKVPGEKISLIHHGFRLELFRDVTQESTNAMRDKYNLKDNYPVVGVISRHTEWKGIQYIIPAFEQLLRRGYPKVKLVLANASGEYSGEIRKRLAGLPRNSYELIAFEENVAALYQTFDVFVHVPVNEHIEAFGQTYVEALAAGIPSVFTASGVAPEFIRHEGNALVVPFQDCEAIFKAIARLLTNRKLCEALRVEGTRDVTRMFALPEMIGQLESLYLT